MNEANFICPKCGGTQLQEVMIDAVVVTHILDVYADSRGWCDVQYVESERPEIQKGEVSHYQCATCGTAIPDCCNPDSLYDWLNEHGMITGQKGGDES